MCHVLHTLGPGGAQELIVTLAHVAPDAGIDLSVVVLESDEGQRNVDRLRELGVEVRSLHLRGVGDPRGAVRLQRALRALRPQIVHTHGRHADLLAALVSAVSRGTATPRVSTVHLVETRRRGWRRVVDVVSARARDARGGVTVTVSQHQHDEYVSAHPSSRGHVRMVYNGIVGGVAATDGDASHEAGLPVVLAAGLLRPDRGYTHLVAAAELMDHEARILVAGEGPLRAALETQAAAGDGRVRFLGFRDDMSTLLRAADVFSHPSLTDALPTVVLHALSHGVPVVASRVGGIPEIVTPDVGVLVPPGDPAALAAALDALLADTPRRQVLAASGRRRFGELFTASAWSGRLRGLYEEVLDAS